MSTNPNMTFTEINSRAAFMHEANSGFKAWAFSVEDDKLMLCVENEVSVCLTQQDQLTTRDTEAWSMLLVARGMMLPAAIIMAIWLSGAQEAKEALSIGDPAALPAPGESETKPTDINNEN
jgi:hypothetical protein